MPLTALTNPTYFLQEDARPARRRRPRNRHQKRRSPKEGEADEAGKVADKVEAKPEIVNGETKAEA